MSLRILSILILFFSAQITFAQNRPPQEERLEWLHEAKFGMFIHWGVYSKYGGV